MNPYVSFGLAMCLVIGLSLFLTAYLAVMFNRRAKADLQRALTPLADLLGGEVELDDARVTGRHRGHIVEGRAANAPEGPGKVFLTSVIDGAGGDKWSYTARRPKAGGAGIDADLEGIPENLAEKLLPTLESIAVPMLPSPGWLRIGYDPVPGHVQLMRPMLTRRDIPEHDIFERQLDALVLIAAVNRSAQHSDEQTVVNPRLSPH